MDTHVTNIGTKSDTYSLQRFTCMGPHGNYELLTFCFRGIWMHAQAADVTVYKLNQAIAFSSVFLYQASSKQQEKV